jgi:hypothetical protein
MATPFWLQRLRAALTTPPTGKSRRKRPARVRPRVLVLEDRVLPSAYVVTTTADGGPGSLRDAINQVNADTSHTLYASLGNPAVDEIDFNITAASDGAGGGTGFNAVTGVATIQPHSALPALTNSVIVDGYTQPGSSANTQAVGDNTVLNIVLDGSQAGTVDGLVIGAGNSTVRGLVIDNFAPGASDLYAGLVLSGGGNDSVTGNFIGTDVTAESAAANANGISITSVGNTIGGTAPADRNIISGNNAAQPVSFSQNGIIDDVGPNGNVIEGNYIGTDRNGTSALGNWIGIHGGNYTTIGGLTTTPSTGAGNVISGNTSFGIDGLSNQNLVAGNLIGTTATGLAALGNGAGIHIEGNNNTIGGTIPGARNVISANGGTGIDIENLLGPGPGGGSYNLVEGNYIGTDITGTVALGRQVTGIGIAGAYNSIGGATAAARNIISGNGGFGVDVDSGTGNSILSNSIFSNGNQGIFLNSANNANHNQAAPVLTGISGSAASPTISGSLTSVANTTFRIEFFANPSPSNLANTEGQTLLGFVYVTTNGSGIASFTSPGLSPIPASEGYLTATATVATPNGNGTYTYGDSSPFSAYRQVSYFFSGFLPPLSTGLSFALNRTIPIKFQLTDLSGNPVTALGAVTSLQVAPVVNGVAGTPFTPSSSDGKGLQVNGGQYQFNWQTKGLAAGTYQIQLKLADGTTQTKTIQLTANGSGANAQATDGSDVSSGSTGGQLLAGDVEVYVDDSNGALTADELARIQDAVTAVDAVTAPYGVTVEETTDPTQATVTLDMDATSPVGGYAQGILGCFDPAAGQITLIQGWDWYAGSDPTQIGAGQYDFETTVTHELGHALGLGESSDSTSAMYGTLAPGTAIRTLTTADLNVPYDETIADAQRAGPPAEVAAVSAPPVGCTAGPAPTALSAPAGSGGALGAGGPAAFTRTADPVPAPASPGPATPFVPARAEVPEGSIGVTAPQATFPPSRLAAVPVAVEVSLAPASRPALAGTLAPQEPVAGWHLGWAEPDLERYVSIAPWLAGETDSLLPGQGTEAIQESGNGRLVPSDPEGEVATLPVVEEQNTAGPGRLTPQEEGSTRLGLLLLLGPVALNPVSWRLLLEEYLHVLESLGEVRNSRPAGGPELRWRVRIPRT